MGVSDHNDHDDIDNAILQQLHRLPSSQSRHNGRHKCPVCAFRLGVKLALEAAAKGGAAEFRIRAGVR